MSWHSLGMFISSSLSLENSSLHTLIASDLLRRCSCLYLTKEPKQYHVTSVTHQAVWVANSSFKYWTQWSQWRIYRQWRYLHLPIRGHQTRGFDLTQLPLITMEAEGSQYPSGSSKHLVEMGIRCIWLLQITGLILDCLAPCVVIYTTTRGMQSTYKELPKSEFFDPLYTLFCKCARQWRITPTCKIAYATSQQGTDR